LSSARKTEKECVFVPHPTVRGLAWSIEDGRRQAPAGHPAEQQQKKNPYVIGKLGVAHRAPENHRLRRARANIDDGADVE